MSATPSMHMHNVLFSHRTKLFSYCRNTFFLQLVKPSGYPYFAWNDRVYSVNAEGTDYLDTGAVVVHDKVAGTLRILEQATA